MKKHVALSCLMLILAVLLQFCTRAHQECTTYTQLTDRQHTIDMGMLNAEAPEITQRLDSMPQLQAYRLETDVYACIVHCHIFYNDLIIFTNEVVMSKSKNDGMVYSHGDEMPDTIALSPLPKIDYRMAIEKARQQIDFGMSCLNYRLGYYDLNASISNQPTEYRLVWTITAQPGAWAKVVLDAHTGAVYYAHDGISYDN